MYFLSQLAVLYEIILGERIGIWMVIYYVCSVLITGRIGWEPAWFPCVVLVSVTLYP